MSFAHLVDPPRRCPGGVLFTIDRHTVERTVFVTDAAIARLDGQATDDKACLRAVMANLRPIIALAVSKCDKSGMPELIVIDGQALG